MAENNFPQDLRELADKMWFSRSDRTDTELIMDRYEGDMFATIADAHRADDTYTEVPMAADYQLERILSLAKRAVIPADDVTALIDVVREPGAGIRQAEDRIYFGAKRHPFRFQDEASARAMIDLIEGFHENKPNPPRIQRQD